MLSWTSFLPHSDCYSGHGICKDIPAILMGACLAQPPSRSFLLQHYGNQYRDSQPDIMQRVRDLRTSVLNGSSPSNPSLQVLGNPSGEETERLKEPERMEDTKESKPSRPNRARAYPNSQGLQQYTQGLYRSYQMVSQS